MPLRRASRPRLRSLQGAPDMAALSAMFALLAVGGFGVAFLTGSGRALAFGMVDVLVGLVAFCIWAWSL